MVDKPKGIPCSTLTKTFSLIQCSYFIDSSLSFIYPGNKPIGEGADTATQPNPKVKADVDQLSLQRNKEMENAMASVYDNLTQDDPKNKRLKKMDEEQSILNVETTPIEEKGQSTIVERIRPDLPFMTCRPTLR